MSETACNKSISAYSELKQEIIEKHAGLPCPVCRCRYGGSIELHATDVARERAGYKRGAWAS